MTNDNITTSAAPGHVLAERVGFILNAVEAILAKTLEEFAQELADVRAKLLAKCASHPGRKVRIVNNIDLPPSFLRDEGPVEVLPPFRMRWVEAEALNLPDVPVRRGEPDEALEAIEFIDSLMNRPR